MSQAQFDSLDESNKQTFLQKQLWIRDNFEVGRLRVSLFSFLLLFSALAAARRSTEVIWQQKPPRSYSHCRPLKVQCGTFGLMFGFYFG